MVHLSLTNMALLYHQVESIDYKMLRNFLKPHLECIYRSQVLHKALWDIRHQWLVQDLHIRFLHFQFPPDLYPLQHLLEDMKLQAA